MNPAFTESISAPATIPFQADLDKIAYAGARLFLFVVPWEAMAQLSGFPLGLWIGSATFAITFVRTLLRSQARKLAGVHLWMLGFATFSAMSILWTTDPEGTLTRIGTYTQLLLVVWMIWELAPTERRVLGLMRAYVWGNVAMAILTLRNYALGTTAAQLENKWGEARYSISGINENDMGLMLAICLPMIFYLALRSKRSSAKLIAWGQLSVCIVAIFLNGSRGSLVSAVISFAMLPLAFRYFSHWQRITAVIACCVIAVCCIVIVPPDIWLRLQQFSSELTSGTLTHRTYIWAAGLATFRDHPWLGVGSGAYQNTVVRLIDVPYVAHNTFLSVLVELGILGEFVWIVIWVGAFYCALRMRSLEKYLWILVLLSWATGVMALTWEYQKATWIMVALLLAHAYSRRGSHSSDLANEHQSGMRATHFRGAEEWK